MNTAFDVVTLIEDLKKEKDQITEKKEIKKDIIDPNEDDNIIRTDVERKDNIIRTDVEREDNIIRTDVEHEDNIIEKEEPIIIKEDNEEIIDDRNNFEPLVDIKAPDGFEMVEHKNEVDIVLNLQRRDSKSINDMLNKELGKCKNYSDVFRAVSKRKGIALGHKEIVIHASYALAAVQLEKEGVKYSLKTLKSRAKSIKNNYLSNQEYMEKYTDRKLQQSFSTKKGSEYLNRHIVNDIYGVFDREKMKQYKKDMEKLLFNMMNAENPEVRSREYQRLMRSVKRAAEITLNNNDVLGNIEKIADANFELLAAAFNYMDDKKKVRSSWDGKARFENALDALAVVRKYASGTKSIIDKYVDSINEKRGTQDRMARWHVDITEFGADNAEAKELAREGDKKLGKMDMFIRTKNKRFVEIKEPEDNPAPQEKKKTSLLEE